MESDLQYIEHTLNFSPSKYAYSFAKGDRSNCRQKCYTDAIYETDNNKSSGRKCSFGYGKKIQLTQKNKSPPPNYYSIQSDFLSNKRKGFSFGLGRDQTYFRSFLGNTKIKKLIPAPNNYQIPSTLKPGRITLKQRLQNPERFKTPGPGSYYPVGIEISHNGRYTRSDIKNVSTISLQNGTVYQRQKYMGSGLGPGTCKQTIKLRQYYLNTWKVQQVFGKDKRPTPDDPNKKFIPGPGRYNIFSQFGIPKISGKNKK